MTDNNPFAAAERRQATVQSEKAFISEAISKLHAIALRVPRLAGNKGECDEKRELKALLRQLYTVICRLSDYRRGKPYAPFPEEDDSEDEKAEENNNGEEDKIDEEEVNGNDDTDDDSDYDDDDEEEDYGDDGGFSSGFKNIPGGFELDQILLGGWHAALEPVDALAKLDPDGPFLAARMILFTQHAISKNKALPKRLADGQERFQVQADLGQDLDETLLVQLRRAWEQSGQTDYLSWASTFFEVDNSDSVSNDYNRVIMSACSSSEFWAVQNQAEKYIIKNRKRRRESMWDGPFRGPSTRQGPIAVPLFNTLIEEHGYGSFSGMGYRGPCLRRSHYFVQDIQQKLNSAMPEETAVLKHINPLGSADIHPYLSRLDIGAAYIPIPKREVDDKECEKCQNAVLGHDISPQATCLNRNIYIWNVALRAFHTFHRGQDGRVSMCKHKGICQGHHSNEEWRVTTKEDVRKYAFDIFESRCHISSLPASAQDWFKAMTTINPHPGHQSRDSKPEHSIRMRFPRLGLGRVEADIRYRREGGLCGLVFSMIHPEVHRQHPERANLAVFDTNKPGQWVYGRSMHEEKEVAKALFKDVRSQEEWEAEVQSSDDSLSESD
ncbi:unnamed protein product [Clonostachys solani]|uniref:Uncharacterized protein n=1 Tax=Clonostachys solani TaxID=160281 RepID=A0A9P0EQB2_9HYPO|nr:unnamed protein product [Clonostachys solani]